MIRRIKDFFKRNRTGILFGTFSGVLIGTSWIPFPPWALAIALAPLWVFATKELRDLHKIFWAGWFTQFTLTLIGFHWIAYVAHEFGFLPWPVAILLLLIYAALMHIYIPLSLLMGAWIAKKWQLSQSLTLFAFATSLAIFEYFWPSIFPWNFGYPLLWTQSIFAQWGDTLGFAGLSWAVLLLNAIFAFLFLVKSPRKWAPVFLITMALLGFAYWEGLQKKQFWSQTDSHFKALMVQANIGNSEKIAAEKGFGFGDFILKEFMDLTQEGLLKHPETEIVIWPETAFPEYLDSHFSHRPLVQRFQSFIQGTRTAFIVGGYSKDAPGISPRQDYNGLFLFDQNHQPILPTYHKTDLLVFGEYVPFSKEFPILAQWNPGGPGWGRGTGPLAWSLELPEQRSLKVGPQICYESLNPSFSRELSKMGAEVLINVTNDSWFGPRFEPWQHRTMTLARAIETRRPLLRSTNTGITTGILADGTLLNESPLFEKWFGLYDVSYKANPPLTFYTQYGKFLPLLMIFVLVCFGIIANIRPRTSSENLSIHKSEKDE